jgi:oligosaccharyltransferase complex subunit beta
MPRLLPTLIVFAVSVAMACVQSDTIERAVCARGGRLARRGPRGPLPSFVLLLACCALAALPAPALAQPRGPRLLVLFDDAASGKRTHASLLDALWRRGYEADVRSASDPTLALRDALGEWAYDHVALLAPSASSLGGDKEARRAAWAKRAEDQGGAAAAPSSPPPAPQLSDLARLVEQGRGNVLMAVAPESPEPLRALALDLGVELDERGARVFDHFARPDGGADGAWGEGEGDGGGEGPAVLARADGAGAAAAAFFGEGRLGGKPVLYRGGAAVVPASSAGTAAVVLSASPAAYTHKPGGAPGVVAALASPPDPTACPTGAAAALAVAVRARNNARVAVVGSLYALSDSAFAAKGFKDAATGEAVAATGNAEFAVALARWAFADRAVLVLENPRHRILAGSTGSEEHGVDRRLDPELLRINDDVEFAVDVWELEGAGSGREGERRPYAPPRDAPLQLSFTMLDPHVRLPLSPLGPAGGNGTLALRFRVPDVYGVFKFTLDHARPALSRLELSRECPVRPLRHDEYERFLLPAYPYYASALSATVALFLVVVAVLYTKE